MTNTKTKTKTKRNAALLAASAAVLGLTASLTAPLTASASTPAPSKPLDWGACEGDGLDPRQECATVDVPMDYSDPDGKKIGIAVSRIPSEKPAARRGALLLIPGGPGGSNVSNQLSDPNQISTPVHTLGQHGSGQEFACLLLHAGTQQATGTGGAGGLARGERQPPAHRCPPPAHDAVIRSTTLPAKRSRIRPAYSHTAPASTAWHDASR
jgi:hypothetical protein